MTSNNVMMKEIILLCFLFLFSSATDSGFRLYTCLQKEILEPTECHLTFTSRDDEIVTLTDNGCFVERDTNQHLKSYCPLQCHEAEDSVLTALRPEISQVKCVLGESVGVVKRRKDWFLWRSLECALEETQFDIRCGQEKKENSTRQLFKELGQVPKGPNKDMQTGKSQEEEPFDTSNIHLINFGEKVETLD